MYYRLFPIKLFIFICSSSFDIKAQVIERTDGLNQYNQQVQSKVERINLKDFGFERHYRIKEDNDKHTKVRSSFLPSNDTSGDKTWRDGQTDRRLSTDNSWHSRRDSQIDRVIESNKSSPVEWTSNPSRIGLTTQLDSNSRRAFNAFNFSSIHSIESEENKQKKNCSHLCVPQTYLQHYRAKGCSPIIDYECNCALSFECRISQIKNATVCEYEGRIYQIGSRIPVRNPCRICECRDFGRRSGQLLAQIDCGVGIECPESAFGIRPEPNCYFGYERNRCCGHQICDNTLIPKRQDKICRYRDRQYKRGQKIYPEEDNCKMCLCTDQWDDNNPLASGDCQTYSCEFQLDKDFLNGCLPIYHEGTCCPIEYKCPKTGKTFPTSVEKYDRNNCLFDGRKYPIGWRLATENVCVQCLCKAPPDFTCLHKTCATPPHNCFVAKWDHTVCCQQYMCSRPDHIRDESQFRNHFYSNRNN